MRISSDLSVFLDSGPFQRVQILGEADISSKYLYGQNFGDLQALLSLLDELHIVEAKPSINDGIKYNKLSIANLEVVMQFDQDLYQILPGFQPSKAVEVKKLAHTKQGHGSKNYATFEYRIKISLRSITSQEQSKLNYTLKRIFPLVNLAMIGSNLAQIESSLDLESVVPHREMSTAQLAKSINFEDAYETYEYLNLAIINSNLVLHEVDDYISSYECPFKGETQKYQKITLNGEMISAGEIINGLKDWRLVSAYTGNTHIIAYKDNDDITVIKVSI
mgnify:CR=1 FL=1